MQQTAELVAATTMDTGTEAELQDCFDTLARSCEQAEVGLEQQTPADEVLHQHVERHKTFWERAARKTVVIGETAWQLSQSSNIKGQNLEQEGILLD